MMGCLTRRKCPKCGLNSAPPDTGPHMCSCGWEFVDWQKLLLETGNMSQTRASSDHGTAIKLYEKAKKLGLGIIWTMSEGWHLVKGEDLPPPNDAVDVTAIIFKGSTLEELSLLLRGIEYGRETRDS